MAAPQLVGLVPTGEDKSRRNLPKGGGMVAQLPTRSVAKWTPKEIDGALNAADSGNLMRAADLVETIMAADDRVSGVLSARTLGMLRLDLSFEGGGDAARSALSANGNSAWETTHPDSELAQLMGWGIVLGVGLGQRKPLPREAFSGHPQMFTLETWHPRWLYQNTYTHEWRVSHKHGTSDVVAGDGQWIMYQPYGVNRPWAKGAWRALAFAWILKQFALHDRARFSEVYGQPIRVGIAPAGANERMRTRWLAALKNLGRDAALVLPPGYDLKLVEVGAGRGIEVFNQQIEWADRAIAVVLAGQVVTTEGTPGFNKGSIHETIKADIIGFTAKSTSTCLYEQSLKPWAGVVYSDVDAAPKPVWDTTLPEDQGAKVEAMKGAGDAIKTLDDALAPSGLKVNGIAIADRFGIPTVALPPNASKSPTVQLAPTDVAKVVLVNEARAGSGLGPLIKNGAPDPDGELTVAQFDLKKAAEINAQNQPTAGPGAVPPAFPKPPSPFTARAGLAGDFDESKHPRADDGKFGSGGGSAEGDSDGGSAPSDSVAKGIVDAVTSKPLDKVNIGRLPLVPAKLAKIDKMYEGKDPTEVAMALDPIELYAYKQNPTEVHMQDGRHRWTSAQKHGAKAIRATITVYDADKDGDEAELFRGTKTLRIDRDNDGRTGEAEKKDDKSSKRKRKR